MPNTERMDGSVVSTEVEGRQVSFFVNDRSDHIQGYHDRGVFYEAEEIDIIRRHFRPGGTFVDVGANIGNHTLYASLYLQPRVVIPFEVNPHALKILRLNLLLNQTANVDTRFLGVGLAATETRLSQIAAPANNLGGARFLPSAQGSLLAIPGDVVLASTPVSFIKIDIEGMELEALRGMACTIARWRPTIFVEVADEHVEQVFQFMGGNDLKPAAQWQRYHGMSNYLFVGQSAQ